MHPRLDRARQLLKGLMAMDSRLDLSGWANAPEVVFRIDRGYSTSWTPYGEWHGTFTNIPSKRYGSQARLLPRRTPPTRCSWSCGGTEPRTRKGAWMILTFLGNGNVDVDWLGRSGWRGTGWALTRVPVSYNPR